MKPRRVPPQIPIAVVRAACGYSSTDEARAAMVSLGVAKKVGHRWKVSRSKLREKDQDVYEDVFAFYEFGQVE